MSKRHEQRPQRRDAIVRRQRATYLIGSAPGSSRGTMTAQAIPTSAHTSVIHPAWVRITHWINAFAMLVMIGSGWEIYNASPLFGFTLPGADHARRLARRRAALALRGDVAAGDQRHRLCRAGHCHRPASAASSCRSGRREVVRDLAAALRGQARARRSRRSTTPCSGCSTLGMIVAAVVIVLSGLSIWKPVQLQWLTALFGGYDARALRAFLRHGGDRRLSRRARRAGADRAEEPARHGHRTLGEPMPRIRTHHSRRRYRSS